MTFDSSIRLLLTAAAVLTAPAAGAYAQDGGSISKEDFISLLETAAPGVKTLAARYSVSVGSKKVLDDQSVKINYQLYTPEFLKFTESVLKLPVKEDPDSHVTHIETWMDLESGRQFLKSNDLQDGVPVFWEMQFDGKEVKTLETIKAKDGKPAGDQKPNIGATKVRPKRDVLGRITTTLPGKLAFSEDWRPEDVTYLPFMGRSLLYAVKHAHKLRVTSGTLDDRPVIVATLLGGLDQPMVYQGLAFVAQPMRLYRYWLSPEKGMMPVRIDALHYRNEDLDGVPYRVQIPSDFRELEPGKWFPHKTRVYQIATNAAPKVAEATIEFVAINQNAPSPKPLEFPASAFVTDEVRGVQYVAGTSVEEEDKRITNLIDEVAQKRAEGGPVPRSSVASNAWVWGLAAALLAANALVLIWRRQRLRKQLTEPTP
jgi:hypothetical protein